MVEEEKDTQPLISKNQIKKQKAIEFNALNEGGDVKMCLKCYQVKQKKQFKNKFKEFSRCKYCRFKQNVYNKKHRNE